MCARQVGWCQPTVPERRSDSGGDHPAPPSLPDSRFPEAASPQYVLARLPKERSDPNAALRPELALTPVATPRPPSVGLPKSGIAPRASRPPTSAPPHGSAFPSRVQASVRVNRKGGLLPAPAVEDGSVSRVTSSSCLRRRHLAPSSFPRGSCRACAVRASRCCPSGLRLARFDRPRTCRRAAFLLWRPRRWRA
jgi:hypothetical protein